MARKAGESAPRAIGVHGRVSFREFARREWEDREGISVDRGLLGDTSSSKLQAPHLARLTELDPIKGLKAGQLKNLISGGRRAGGSYGSSAARPGSAQHDFRAIFGDNCEACRPLHSRLHGELRPRLRLARHEASCSRVPHFFFAARVSFF